jgi:Spy/CpxP family protein refolding chaperone
MKTARITATLLVFSLIAGAALAQAPGGGRGNRGNRGGGGMMLLMAEDSLKRLTEAIDKLDLTSDQKEKIADLKKEYEPKFKEVGEKATKLLTDDQKKAFEDGLKKVHEATGRERGQAMQELTTAVKLTSDQQTKLREIGTDFQPLMREARTKFTAILTDEQKAKLPPAPGGRGRGNRGGGNNPAPAQST